MSRSFKMSLIPIECLILLAFFSMSPDQSAIYSLCLGSKCRYLQVLLKISVLTPLFSLAQCVDVRYFCSCSVCSISVNFLDSKHQSKKNSALDQGVVLLLSAWLKVSSISIKNLSVLSQWSARFRVSMLGTLDSDQYQSRHSKIRV